MSILIKGMDMPKCCTECSCCRHDNWNGETAHQCNVSFITFGAEDENWIYDQRPNWCPLVEISTPHGRLIDADELIRELASEHVGGLEAIKKYTNADTWTSGLHTAWRLIDDASTVIEAEGENDGR